MVHPDFTFSAGSCRGGGGGGETVNGVDIGNGKGSPKGSEKGKSKIVQFMETGMLILAGLMQAGREGKWSGRGKGEGREGGKRREGGKVTLSAKFLKNKKSNTVAVAH